MRVGRTSYSDDVVFSSQISFIISFWLTSSICSLFRTSLLCDWKL